MINANKNSEPLDLSYLKEMSGDSPEFIIEMIDLFKSQTPIYLSELQDAIVQKDWDKVAATAHKMKPTFTYVGREDVKEHLQEMEQGARDKSDMHQLANAFEEVRLFISTLYAQLDEAKANLQKQL
ncbi:MAG: Hpt domain-containing protein [Pedobacter sp.]|uniref:Hpt domain-containing protein n=1 Tax=Pedobacter sp. JCM 36344 TaxID=3374280 RepID=UPI001999AA6B|nr:Hpt domain-containing protein [Pedobacter sp.]